MATVRASPVAGGVTESKVGGGVGDALERHFRSAADDSKVDFSPAWTDARVSIRYLNHMSPLMLGIIQRPGTNASLTERKVALNFMIASTDALAKVIAERLAVSPEAKAYERVELNSMLSHIVGRIWEKSTNENEQAHVDDFVRTVSSAFTDPGFLASHTYHAKRMMEKVGYLKVDSPETMHTRIQLSMHQAMLRFFEAVTDERLCNGKGLAFTFGCKKAEVVAAMQADFAEAINTFLSEMSFAPVLSNDQRTTVMQSWIRQASEIYRAEYVSRTQRVMDWFRAGQEISQVDFETRFVRATKSLPEVLQKTRSVTIDILSDLVGISGFDGSLPAPNVEPQAPKTWHPQ